MTDAWVGVEVYPYQYLPMIQHPLTFMHIATTSLPGEVESSNIASLPMINLILNWQMMVFRSEEMSHLNPCSEH